MSIQVDTRTVRERLTGWRNALLASPRFRRWAASFPLTRPIARRRARALFDLVAGFTYSQVTVAFVTLDLPAILGQGAMPAEDVAARAGLPVEGARRLLHAAAALGLTEDVGGGRYMLGRHGAALAGDPGIAAMVAHHGLLYADLADPVALLRRGGGGGSLSAYWPYAEQGEGDAAPYSALMAASQPMVAEQVLDAYSLGRHRRLLDVGGGEGAFLAAVAARYPALELTLFDLPEVAARARQRLGDRARIVGGSFRDDALPQGADIITLVRVLHDHDDSTVMTILSRARAALPAGGTLLVAEPMAETGGAKTVGAYFDFYLLAMGSGRPRSVQEISAMMRVAGFSSVRHLRTRLPLVASIVVATG